MTTEKKIEYLQRRLRIDEHALEVELRDLPILIDEAGQAHVLAISLRDEAKQELDELEAKVDSEIRFAAVEKITEKDIESQKKQNPKIQAANKKFLQLKKEAAQLGIVKEAVDQRSYALSKLVDLYISNYYSNMEKKGPADFKSVQSERVKTELKRRRVVGT